MKTIGLIGGMSWESTIPYYRHINEAVKQRLGGLHSARIVLVSVDFHDHPSAHHATIVRQYPKHWAPPGSSHGRKEGNRKDKKEGN